jgi:hypothetical protein
LKYSEQVHVDKNKNSLPQVWCIVVRGDETLGEKVRELRRGKFATMGENREGRILTTKALERM